jgi:hypothetical protein
MYPVVLFIHNLLRWVVLVLGVIAILRVYRGWFGKMNWTDQDRKFGVFFSSAIDTQLLVGILLYVFLSPITRSAFQDFGTAMSISDVRFYTVEHAFLMILAVVFGHLGTLLPKKVKESARKYRRAALWFTLALLAILAGIPWSRPLIPGL